MALAALANCTTLDCFIPELQNLHITLHQPPPRAGLQDFHQGCLLAVNSSLQVKNGALAFSDHTCHFHNPPLCTPATLAAILQASASPSSPLCGTNAASVPEIVVPYTWCATHIPGWQRSKTQPLSQWIGPLVQFILPSLAFCLSIPRSWKFAVPGVVFASRNGKLDGLVAYAWKLPLALVIVTLDTVFWLSMCFAFAGPMLFSAVYEYTLDRKIIDYLSAPVFVTLARLEGVMPADALPTFVLCTLVGNLRFESQRSSLPAADDAAGVDVWAHIMQIASEFE